VEAPVTNAIALAAWLARRAQPLDHLKLQKLAFYAYGAALSRDLDDLGDLRFYAWRHGPVNLEIYHEHKGLGRAPVPVPAGPGPAYSAEVEDLLGDVVAIYSRLSSWQLREESHLEAPWQRTPPSAEIPREVIQVHFKAKFARGAVALPRNLLGAWSFAADGLATQTWESLRDLANALRA
jgi:uncharacterized phage-associated protein